MGGGGGHFTVAFDITPNITTAAPYFLLSMMIALEFHVFC